MNPHTHRSSRRLLACLVALAGLALGALVDAQPFRGSTQWSVILCRYQDSGTPPNAASFYQDKLLRVGAGGMGDYWNAVSYGSLNFNGSDVRGWYTVPMTIAGAQAIRGGGGNRGKLQQDCLDAARNDRSSPYTVPAGNRVIMVTYPDMDLFGGGGRAFVPYNVDLGYVTHEAAHALGLEHSYSDDPEYRNYPGAPIGEYDDPWDVMSYGNAYGAPTRLYGSGAPGLNAYHVDRMGWLPRSRIVTLGADGRDTATVTLAALNHPEASGALLVRVPFNPGDPFHYYTVEFRKKDGWDAGIPQSTVLIHEVKAGPGGKYYTYLLRNRTGGKNPLQSLDANGVRISVAGLSPGTNQATVTVSSAIVSRCLSGYVWREAGPNDRVCVIPALRDLARNNNAQAQAFRQPGSVNCRPGYVWREAFSGDLVCVVPQIRAQAQADNAQAASRLNPGRFVYGPNTCRSGFVWREADDRDFVCVLPAIRDMTRAFNAQANSTRDPLGGAYGQYTCRSGFVWREAFPGDLVCVTPQVRAQAAADNRDARSRLLRP